MPGIDDSKQFVPLKIAVLTVSDSRNLKDDKSGALLVQRIGAAGHLVAERSIVPDDIEAIRARVKSWIADPVIDVIITTGGTGFTGRDVTPEAVEPLFEKKMDAFSALFLVVSFQKIGTSAVQSRATAGVAGGTYIFCLPGSPSACRDAWDEILVHQLDYRYGPCNFVEIMPRLDEHLQREKAKGATVQLDAVIPGRGQSPRARVSITTIARNVTVKSGDRSATSVTMDSGLASSVRPGMTPLQLQIPVFAHDRAAPALVLLRAHQFESGLLIDVARGGEHAVRP